jgi:hypothetical protein
MLLEGWQYGEIDDPRFESVHRDNETLFSTRDRAEFRSIVTRYGIRYVIAKPGTDVGLPEPHPAWLRRVPIDGVAIYEIAPTQP